MGFSLEGFDLKKEIKELKSTSRCFKDYISFSLRYWIKIALHSGRIDDIFLPF